jgi:hypothetical protein
VDEQPTLVNEHVNDLAQLFGVGLAELVEQAVDLFGLHVLLLI